MFALLPTHARHLMRAGDHRPDGDAFLDQSQKKIAGVAAEVRLEATSRCTRRAALRFSSMRLTASAAGDIVRYVLRVWKGF